MRRFQPLLRLLPQLGGFIGDDGLGRREARQDRIHLAWAIRAALRDLGGIGDRLRQVGEQLRHVLAAFEIMLGRQLAPIVFGDDAAFGDADQRIMRFIIVRCRKERLVGRDQRQRLPIGDIQEMAFGQTLLRQAVTLDFDIKPVAEQSAQLLAALLREIKAARDNGLVEDAQAASGQRDDAVGFLVQP